MEREQATTFMNSLLVMMGQRKASDLFLTSGFPPALKVDGEITPVSKTALTPMHTLTLARSIMNDKQAAEFERTSECNFAINPPGTGRFRCSAFMQQNHVGIVIRTINVTIPRFEELMLPPILRDIIMAKRGLVIFVGATGSGKTTSMRRWSTIEIAIRAATSSPSKTPSSLSTNIAIASSRNAKLAATPRAGPSR